MMKMFSYFLLVMILLSCQKESLVVVEDTPNENFTLDSELIGLMLSVSAHDGSFDDVLDSAGCFSIQFPYTISYNGESRVINSVNDLLGIEKQQDVVFQYPIDITFSNYITTRLNSDSELASAVASCTTNETFLNSIKCVDFVYPIRIATFNSDTNVFSTLIIDHDQQNFVTVNSILEEQLAEIRYPITLQTLNNEVLEINSSQELKQIIYTNAQGCQQ